MRKITSAGKLFSRFRNFIIVSAFALIFCGLSFFANERAMAVDIRLAHMTSGSDNPDSDPNASKLIALMNVLETYYEDIFEQDLGHEFTVYYRYEADVTSLAQYSGNGTPLTDSNGYPLCGLIRINPNVNWFIDETPLDNSEYNMNQVFYSDLSSTQQTTRFNGNVPDLLEVAYEGTNNYSNPDVANAYDLWSVVMHEMGHGLGMLGCYYGNDVGDEDYDFPTQLAWGYSMAANCFASDNLEHLKSSALMDPYTGKGERHLPAMVDILSMADGAEWNTSTIDLKRQDFYSASSSASFNTTTNWAGNRLPDQQDDAFIRHGGTVTLSADANIGNLTVGNNSTLAMTGHTLLLLGQTRIGTSSTDTATVDVGTGSFAPVDLTIAGGSTVTLGGGLLAPKACTANLSSAIRGYGTLTLYNEFNLGGTLSAQNGTLTIQASPGYNPAIDLTYTSSAKITAENGNVIFDLPLNNPQDGLFYSYGGGTITFNSPVTLSSAGRIYLYGSSSTAGVAGAEVTFNGFLYASGSHAEVNCPMVLTSDAEVSFASSTATFSQSLEVQAGAYLHGTGTLVADAPLICRNGATIDIGIEANDQIILEAVFGSATFNKTLLLSSTAELLMDIGKSHGGTIYHDHLIANSYANLGGATLSLSLPAGTVLAIGDQFDLFDWNSTRINTFASVITPAGYVFDLSDLYAGGTITVQDLVQEDIPGDANRDGYVDGSDATILSNYWLYGVGMTSPDATWEMGDFNGDHIVDGSDATILASYWLEGTPPLSAVPEPSTVALLLSLAAFGLFGMRRRVK